MDEVCELIQRSGILIPRKYENTQEYIDIKNALQRRSKSYNTPNYIINTFYIESQKFLLVPRYFPIKQYIHSYSMKNYMHYGEDIQIEHNIEPRSQAQEKAMEFMLNHENGILQLAPGVGKTVISIFMIATRKKKTIILVHRDPLAQQWLNRILQFTNLKEEQIARLTSGTFEEDLKKPIIIATDQTFISLLKRNREQFLKSIDKAKIGIFIADEVHTSVGAPTFSECSIHIPSRYTYGLSATPYRYDGNGDIIEFHLGDIFSDDDIEGTMGAKVTVFLLDYQIDTMKRTKYIRWDGVFQRARYLNLMKKSKPFREAMRGLLTKLKDGRDLICMVERVKLIDELYQETNSDSKSKFCGNGTLETLDYKLTFATPGKCRDGVDAPWKDTIIMTSPISNIEQLTGRVIRINSDKKTPIVIDMVDFGCKDISRTFWARKRFYENKKWPIRYFLFSPEKGLKPLEEHEAIDLIGGST
jgi:superfamily II DNA or RNA helicase